MIADPKKRIILLQQAGKIQMEEYRSRRSLQSATTDGTAKSLSLEDEARREGARLEYEY